MRPPGRALDVSGLPKVAFGERSPLWWGIVLLVAIEGTMISLLVVSYFYIRGNYELWPPQPLGSGALFWASAGVACALASLVPVYLSDRAARRSDLRGMKLTLAAGAVIELAFLATRALELRALPFSWSSSAHGSLVWVILGVHTFHLLLDSAETVVLTVLFLAGPVQNKHRSDVHVNAVYWYFIALGWLPLYGILYFDGFGTW